MGPHLGGYPAANPTDTVGEDAPVGNGGAHTTTGEITRLTQIQPAKQTP